MSQILMKTERDLGAMFSFEPRKKDHPLRYLKLDLGFFNGQGLAAVGDYDSYKDIIGRAALNPLKIAPRWTISAGLSGFYGRFLQNTRYQYKFSQTGGLKMFVLDSALSNINSEAPRRYAGADIQLKYRRSAGYTELRAEYW